MSEEMSELHQLDEKYILKLEAKVAELEAKYHELLYAVGSKFGGETRHETVLRYIVEHEDGTVSYVEKENRDE